MNFKESADLLAQGVNFQQNACILSVGLEDLENLNITTSFSGGYYNVLCLVEHIIDAYIGAFKDDDKALNCDILIKRLEELKK